MPRSDAPTIPWTAIEAYMDARGLSGSRWARDAEIDQSNFSKWKKAGHASFNAGTLAKLAAARGLTPPQLLTELAGNFQLYKVGIPVLQTEDLIQIRFGHVKTTAELTVRETLPIGHIEPDSGHVGAFEIRDSSVDRQVRPPGYAVIDWSRKDLISGKFYLIFHQGEPMVRVYLTDPQRWEADSTDRYQTVYANGARVEVVATVLGFYRRPEFLVSPQT